MAWNGVVTKYYKKHSNKIELQPKVEAYIQSVVLKNTLERVSFERRRGIEEEDAHEGIRVLMNRIGVPQNVDMLVTAQE